MVSVIPDPVDYNSLVNTISKELLKYSGRQKLDCILQSKYIDGDHDKFVALYVDVAQKLPVTFIDFRKFHQRMFISYGVIDAFFYLMNQQFHGSISLTYNMIRPMKYLSADLLPKVFQGLICIRYLSCTNNSY